MILGITINCESPCRSNEICEATMIDVFSILISGLVVAYVAIRAVIVDRRTPWFPERRDRDA